MPSFEIFSQLNLTLLFSGGLLGVLIIVFLIMLPMLERRIPILKALALTRRLKGMPVIGTYYSQVRSVNAQISEVLDQGNQISEEKMRLEKAWDKTVSQNGGHNGSAQNNNRSENRKEVDKQKISNGTSGGWSPQRSGMAQPGHRSGPAPRGFMPPAAKNQTLPQSSGQTMVTWALTEKKLLESQPDEKRLPYNPPIGRIPVPPEFDVDIDNSSKMSEAALLGRRIERYQVDAILHEGELSHVYQTYDMKIGRLVALKLMSFPDYLTREGEISIFEDMRTLSSADHPNLTHIYDFGEDEGRLFVVSQLVKGVPIHTHLEHMMLQGLPVELGPILETVANVAGALAEVHDLQLVHGLIKPGHLLLEPISATNKAFDVKLLDVGLINLYPTIQEIPDSFWPYLSPEYCLTGRIDSRSDLYSIGALLYHLLTGQPPFNPTSTDQAVQLHNWTDPIPPTNFNQTLPEVVEHIILKALAKEPNDRFQSASELKQALLAAANPVTGRYEDRKFLKEGDRLLTITAPGQGRKTVVIDQSTSFAGSGAENDIILTGVDISARHMRLDIDGPNFVVTNISTKNTVYLQGVRMLPDLPEIWEEGNPIQIGAYTLSWEEIVEDQAVKPPL
ncbi:MAG: FHA domain-containing serine/threonine-protein kinase, partial [Chloroflexota bacterium]